MSKRKLKILRIMAAIMLISIINQILFPTVAMALTSMTVQPEIYGYQPVDATDNVNIGTGGFNYTIPITSIPEFPMAIAYNSGLGMDHEASVFGFGFNGFSGAIARSVNGLPDDLNGAVRSVTNLNEPDKDFNITYGGGVGFSLGVVKAGATENLTFGYNNYTGAYAQYSLGFGAALLAPADNFNGVAGAGVELIDDSRQSTPVIAASASIGLSLSSGQKNGNIQANTGIGAGVYVARPINSPGSKTSYGGNIGAQQFSFNKSPVSQSVISTMAPLAYIYPDRSSNSHSFSITVPFPPLFVDFGAAWSKSTWDQSQLNKTSYGFMFLSNYDRSNDNQIADMTIEGEDSFNSNGEYNSPCYLQKDNYSVNTMGVSGGMELYQPSYGVVSRNHFKQTTATTMLLASNVMRNEVEPWVSANQVSLNKSTDFFAMLKNPSNELDNLFTQDPRVNLNGSNQRFSGAPVFKMRGDYAGEYDLASQNFTDHGVSPFTLEPVQGSSRKIQLLFLGVETRQPIKYPSATVNYNAYAANHQIERTTNIIKHSIGEILSAASVAQTGNQSWVNIDPTSTPTSSSDPTFIFNQSFYSHYNYVPSAPVPKASNVVLNNNNNIQKMNILKHLHDDILVPSGSYVNDLVGSMEVQTGNGLRYFFNLPVFNKTSKGVALVGKGVNPPQTGNDGDYHSYIQHGAFHFQDKNIDRNKTVTQENYVYPYAWLLTAIVGDDYIDFDNIPGPSDGDIGYWVKFKYVKVADNYRWRNPFTCMEDNLMILDRPDDIYSVITGQKEIYNLSEIESSNYICKYQYQKRFDGVDAAGYWNGDAYNALTDIAGNHKPSDPTGSNFQFAVTEIDLFKKHSCGTNSENINVTNLKIIKSTQFYYDYTTCPGVLNNYTTSVSNSVLISSLPYHIAYPSNAPIETGKLTLRKVQHIAYDETGNIANATFLPSYTFEYYGDVNSNYNPAYDHEAYDQWGNYISDSKDVPSVTAPVPYYHHYTEIVKSQADENAKVYKLKTIQLPSGGSMNMEYQAQSYGFVEDQTPYSMRHINSIAGNGNGTSTLTIDVTDIGSSGILLSSGTAPSNATTTSAFGDERNLLNVGDTLYGEIAFYKNINPSNSVGLLSPNNAILVTEEAIVVSMDATTTYNSTTNRYYQNITLQSLNNDNYSGDPFVTQCQQNLYLNSTQSQAVADALVSSGGCGNVDAYEQQLDDQSQQSMFGALKEMFVHFVKMFQPARSKKAQYVDCFGEPGTGQGGSIYPHLSFLRTPIYKGKYTGAVVKSVKLRDNFQYATLNDGSEGVKENEYGTVYFYDLNGDGTGTSAGVATNEPGGGKACVIDNNSTTGAGFGAAPTIMCSKITLENLYHDDSPTAQVGDVISRKKGKTSYDFYTPKDPGFQFASNFQSNLDNADSNPIVGNFFLFGMMTFFKIHFRILGRTINIRLPHFIPLILNWHLEDHYHLQSYAYTDITDMFGKVKAIHQLDATGMEMGNQTYNYYGTNDPVTVYRNVSGPDPTVQKPGKVDQAWSEAFYTRQDNINRFAAIVLIATTKKNFSYTNMKYSYIAPMLKGVTSTIDGLSTATNYTAFDYYTGTPVEVRSNDSYQNTKISRTVPAYWVYPAMGPSSVNSDNLNNLTATSGTYMYLNNVNPTSLIGAGVVQWANGQSGGWDIVPYLQPNQNFVDPSTINYTYNQISGSTIRSAYTASAKSNDPLPAINRNASIYKPYKGYTYEVPLNADGTFSSFVDFSYQSGATNATWKQLSTNELYTENGVLVQSQDVLSKYAAQLLGYNFSNTIGAVSNASWVACAYDGAENTYTTPSGTIMLEANKVQLKAAKVEKACENQTFIPKTLNCKNLSSGNLVRVTLPTAVNYNVPFAKIDVNYTPVSGNNQGILRELFVSVNDNNEITMMSNMGEVFQGFLEYPNPTINNTFDLYFNPADYSYFALDNTFTVPSGYTVSSLGSQALPNCECTIKSYTIPGNDCGVYTHTGNYAFILDAGNNTGTDFVIQTNKSIPGHLTEAEFMRKYKALVWVHNSSPPTTELVVQRQNAAGQLLAPEISTSKATPYVQAGDWTLLRLDFDLSNVNPQGTYVHVFMRNAANANTLWAADYDDFRVLPYHADMTNWVFDHHFNRVLSGLDVDNFASYSIYDSRGRVTESSVELQNSGKTVVQKFLYNDQKKN